MSTPHSSPATRYSRTAQYLHWLVAGGIVLQFVLGERAEEAADAGELQIQLIVLANHKSIGITVLLLVLLRIAWRWFQRPPALPASYIKLHPHLARLAPWAHVLLYALLLTLPISGWLMSSASAYSVSWFNLVQLPDLIGPGESAKAFWGSVHEIGAKLLFVVAVVHILAAFKHFFFDKDGVMQRIAGPLPLAAFGVSIAAGLWLTAEAAPDQTQPTGQTPTSSSIAATEFQVPSDQAEQTISGVPNAALPSLSPSLSPSSSPESSQAVLPVWKIDHSDSHIHFVATQAGAEFAGQFARFEAEIRFSPNDLTGSSATVNIDATSVATQDAERDSTLAGDDWFDSKNYAHVKFSAATFSETSAHLDTAEPKTADSASAASNQRHFDTEATLDIRGTSYAVPFQFSVTDVGDKVVLKGNTRLDRLALNLGTREWSDTEWVGQYVDVSVRVVAEQ